MAIMPLEPVPTLLIHDAAPADRDAICALLAASQAVRLIGDAASQAAAEATTRQERPQLLILSATHDAAHTAAILRALRQGPCPADQCSALALARYADLTFLAPWLDPALAITGYFLWHELTGEALSRYCALLCSSPRLVMISQALADVLLPLARDRISRPTPLLSAREQEILPLLADATLDYATIAQQLFCSRHTVRTHVRRLAAKLGVPPTRRAVVDAARARGLLHR